MYLYVCPLLELLGRELVEEQCLGIYLRCGLFTSLTLIDENSVSILFKFCEIL